MKFFRPFSALLWGILIVLSFDGIAQDSLNHPKSGFFHKLVDTFIDKDLNNWSVRGISNFKEYRFDISNEDYTLQYIPNNRSGVGFGVATSKLLIDIILNIKTNKENLSDRFDMQGDILLNQSFFTFQVQRYKGFNVENIDVDVPIIFRRDIQTNLISLNFMYLFDKEWISPSKIFTGEVSQYKSNGTFAVGGNFNYSKYKADSSLIPSTSVEFFNEEAQFNRLNQYGIEIIGGYSYFLKLPANFFILFTLNPGLGLNFKEIKTDFTKYNPNNIWEISIFTLFEIGYNGPRWYVNLRNIGHVFLTSLDHQNRLQTEAVKLKFAVGWKLRRQE